AVGDFNGYGKPDLAAIIDDCSDVCVLLDRTPAGATTPSFAPQKAFPVGTHPLSLAVGDFNGDGKPDLAVGNNVYSTNVSVLLNKIGRASCRESASEQAFPGALENNTLAEGVV